MKEKNLPEERIMQKLVGNTIRDFTFLRGLAEGVNLSFRYHGDKSAQDLMKILQKKLGAEKLDTVFKMYLACYELEEIVQEVRPRGMSEIVNALESFFSDHEHLEEVTVGSRRCDVVILSGTSSIAIEVKSSLDKVSSALAQLSYYKKWANEVYLAYDVQHKNVVRKLPFVENGVGLLQFSKRRIYEIHKSPFYPQEKATLLSLMTFEYLRNIALDYRVKLEGGKQAISHRLCDLITQYEVQGLFQDFLRSRALV